MIVLHKTRKNYPWNLKSSPFTRSKLPAITNTLSVDYHALNWLNSIHGLSSSQNPETSAAAHTIFMGNYHKIFAPELKKHGGPVLTEQRTVHGKIMIRSESNQATGGQTSRAEQKLPRKKLVMEEFTHNIKDYLPLLHKEPKSQDADANRATNIKTLRKLLCKLPFERTTHDNDRIFAILKTYSFFAENLPSNVLKELCVVAQKETWQEANFTVFGSTGLHMILRGKVAPLTEPYILTAPKTLDGDIRSPTPLLESPDTVLEVGDCFGSLQKLPHKATSTRLLSVKTLENNCEFMKISVSDYARVIEQIRLREHTEKLNLLLSCSQYRTWPRQPLIQVATSMEWIIYPPNTVIVSEGYKAPFIGFIKAGQCHVLRQVDVSHTLQNGHKEKQTKQVVMGKLGPSDSFAELSLLQGEPVTCSIVTATDVEMGVIKPGRLHELDQVTVQLFKHSSTRTLGDLTKEDIQNEYVEQEQKRAWNEFKHKVIVDVINASGIRPGYGKWAK